MSKRAFVGLLAALLMLAGCVGLPNSGPVNSISPSKTSSGSIGLAVQPPARGATPKQIVDGFLLASQAGLDDDFAVARQYLYADAATNWKPLARVRIYPQSQEMSTTVTESGAVRASVGSLGTLSSRGTYTETASHAVLTNDFSLAKNKEGQWRIVNLDDGIFLPEHLFNQRYVETSLYFLAADSNALVADLRYYPQKTFATSAVNGLLAGPSAWLADGVHTAAPAGTKLLKSVDIVNGVATVDLSSEVLVASAEQRAVLLQQIRRTLSASNAVRDVSIKVEGSSELDVDATQDLPAYPFGSFLVSAISGGLPADVNDSGSKPLIKDPTLAGSGLTNLAVSYQASGRRMAALGNGGTALIGMDTQTGNWNTLLRGTSLAAPSYDRYGWVWTAERDNSGSLYAFNPKAGGFVAVDAPWLVGTRIRDVEVSRDGSVMIVINEVAGDTIISAAAITRDDSGGPSQLGDPMVIGQHLADATDAVWVGPNSLAVLAKTTAGTETGIFKVRVGGPTERVATPYEGTIAITAGRDEDSIVALTDKGIAYSRDGGAWRTIATEVTSVAYPG